MPVPNQTPYIVYNANGLTTVFPFEFYVISASDIQVSLNGVPVTSGYTVSGVGNVSGGDVIFLTPPASGAVVMLERIVPTYRLTDYQDNGDLLADTVNKDFDRLWMAIQRSFIYLGLALRRPLLGGPFNAEGYRIANLGYPQSSTDGANKKYVDDTYSNLLSLVSTVIENLKNGLYGYNILRSFELGNTLVYANDVLLLESEGEYYRWDGSLPKVVPPGSTPESTGGTGLGKWISVGDSSLRTNLHAFDGSKLIGICQSIEELKSITANAGERVQVKGYYSFSSTGGGDFVYIESIPEGWHDEGIYIKSIAMSGYWQRIGMPSGMDLFNWGLANVPGEVISDLGEVLNRAMIHNRNPVIPNGTWIMASIASIPSYTTVSGQGVGNTVILREGSINSLFMNASDGTVGGYGASFDITLQDFTIDARMDEYPAACTPVGFGHSTNIKIYRLEVNNVPGRWHAIELNSTYNAIVEDCIFNRGGLNLYDGECIQLDAALAGGPFPWFGPYDSTVCGKIHINRCTFSDWSSAIGSHSGVAGSRWIELRITDCSMYVSKAGIKLIGWSGVTISRNRIIYATSVGYTDTNQFFGITMEPSSGVINSDVIIVDNVVFWEQETAVTGAGHRGILVKGNGTDAAGSYQNVLIANNIVRGSFRTHISADDIVDVRIVNNTVQQVGQYASGASNFAGIAAYGTRTATISDNYVGSGFHIICSKGGQTVSMSRAIVTGNNVSGNISVDNEFTGQAVTGNVCNSISGGTILLAARNVGKYRSKSVICVGNVESGVTAEAQITTS